MLKIYPNTIVYVHCPAGVVTGGAELLHQLVSFLNDNGRESYIVYWGEREHSLPLEYQCYNIKITDNVVDSNENVEVIYEGIFNFVSLHKSTQKFLWWLSVDHFYTCSTTFLSITDLLKFNFKLGMHSFLKRMYFKLFSHVRYPKEVISIKKLRELDAINGYQSEYAQHFLQIQGFREQMALKDYINTEHFSHSVDSSNREDIILYNPKKGLNYTRKLIAKSPDLKWIPIQNMTRSQLIQLMETAKVYVDFGYHPGKDRLPRECAANGCCVITGMRGSAAFFEDVMIPKKYKFDEKKASINEIVNMIRWTLNNYESAINDFQLYRKKILSEKKEFEEQIAMIFL